jgi:hypothetical protein
MSPSGHLSIGGHRVALLVRTARLCKPRAAEIELQRQSLVPPAIAERSLAGPHTELSGARSGRRIVMRRNLVFVDLPKDRCLMLDYLIAPGYQARR